MRSSQTLIRFGPSAFLHCVACAPAVDPPPLELAECSAEASPTELARLPYDPENDYETFDLIDGFTIHVDPGGGLPSAHYLVDNCGGAPLRLQQTFSYRPGAARVGGELVLCSGGRDGLEGVWEILENGTAGAELGLGRACADRLYSAGNRVGLSALGVVGQDEHVVQHLPDGTTRSFPFGTFHQLGDALIVEEDGEVTLLPPDGAEPIVLELPEPILNVAPSPGWSRWGLLLPDDERDYSWVYALDATTGEWFRTEQGRSNAIFGLSGASARDGLAAVYAYDGTIALSRLDWSAPLPADLRTLGSFVGLTVVDAEHVYLRQGDDLRLIRVPMEYPAEGEDTHEVLWTRSLAQHELPADGVGIPWKDVVLDATNGELWAYPLDGSEPYPFLPWHETSFLYFGSEYVTALGKRDRDAETLELFRNSLGGEFELLDGGILDFQDRPWTPEFGRIIYAVRDGDEVSIRQHRLTD